jgi:alpha-mannosidase
VRYTLLTSVITQDIAIYSDSARVDFITHVDWREHHLLLKVAFPLDLRVTQARSEIQYGSITRPTHRNTSWDQARFETIAHRWVDLSESAYGVALLNDGKYGHDIHDSTIRLSILRSPTSPAPDADQGSHEVTYSLLPHEVRGSADTLIEEVIRHGYALNRPLMAIRPLGETTTTQTSATSLQPLFTLDAGGAVIEAIKRAADGEALIVRVYEALGSRMKAHITVSLPLADVIESDLMERPLREGDSPAYDLWRESLVASHDAPLLDLDHTSSGLTLSGWTFSLRPYEIRTFRVTLRRP